MALFAHDAHAGVSGVAHMVLPRRRPDSSEESPGTFVDTAVGQLRRELESAGADLDRVKWAFVGGAEFARFASGKSLPALELGRRNSEAVAAELGRLGATISGSDTGGPFARDISFCTADAEVKVRTINEGEKSLCNLQ